MRNFLSLLYHDHLPAQTPDTIQILRIIYYTRIYTTLCAKAELPLSFCSFANVSEEPRRRGQDCLLSVQHVLGGTSSCIKRRIGSNLRVM